MPRSIPITLPAIAVSPKIGHKRHCRATCKVLPNNQMPALTVVSFKPIRSVAGRRLDTEQWVGIEF